MHRPDHRRAGMTLVELLVVVAIIGLLAVTVLPNLSNTAETRRTRETARAVSTWVSKAQSRAIGRTEWAGFWILPVNTAAPYAAAIDIQLADVPEVYRGESLQSQVTTSAPTGALKLTWFLRNLQFNPALPPDRGINTATWQSNGQYLDSVARGDLIRFDGTGPWFELVALSPPGTIGLLFPDLQRIDTNPADLSIEQGRHPRNPLNTAWPLETVPHAYEILRQPVRTGAPYSFADGRCIDLYWSGQQTSTGFALFGANGSTPWPTAMRVAILFDSTGRVRELFHRGTRVAVEGTIYLLVGRADRAGQGLATLNANDDSVGANWQYGDSYWIAIDPNSGMAKVAEVAISAANATGDVIGSQSFIRSQLVTGGR
jgi:prepilin-type N-terminal cleavage/methylation domain-containing protein